jgi:hypothetical protein
MILGHSSPDVARKIYAHLMRKGAAEQVERATELLTRHRGARPGEELVADDRSTAGRE